MAKVSRTVRIATQAYIAHVFNPHRLLSGYFEDVSSFRTLQARTRSLISGRAALHFFDRASYPSSPLDLHVHFHHRREVVHWLLDAGYTFLPSPDQSPDIDFTVAQGIVDQGGCDAIGLCGTLNFGMGEGESYVTIRVVVALRTPVEVILLSHSSEFRGRHLLDCFSSLSRQHA